MTDDQKTAFLLAAIARVNARVAAMQSENLHRLSCGNGVAYAEDAFLKVIEEEGIGHDEVVLLFRRL